MLATPTGLAERGYLQPPRDRFASVFPRGSTPKRQVRVSAAPVVAFIPVVVGNLSRCATFQRSELTFQDRWRLGLPRFFRSRSRRKEVRSISPALHPGFTEVGYRCRRAGVASMLLPGA